MNIANRWSKEELGILSENVHLNASELIGLLPGRTIDAITTKKIRFKKSLSSNLKKQILPWSKEEDIIISNNKHLTDLELSKLLPDRTIQAITKRRSRIFPTTKKLITPEEVHLSAKDELEILELNYKNKLKEVTDTHYEVIRALERETESLITKLKKDHKEKINKLETIFNRELRHLENDSKAKYREQQDKQQRKLSDLNRYYKGLISAAKEKLAELQPKNESSAPIIVKKTEIKTAYENAIEELTKISNLAYEPVILGDKELIIGEITYLMSMEKNVKVRKNINNGIINALMTKPNSYWTNGISLKLEQWMERLEVLGQSVELAEAA